MNDLSNNHYLILVTPNLRRVTVLIGLDPLHMNNISQQQILSTPQTLAKQMRSSGHHKSSYPVATPPPFLFATTTSSNSSHNHSGVVVPRPWSFIERVMLLMIMVMGCILVVPPLSLRSSPFATVLLPIPTTLTAVEGAPVVYQFITVAGTGNLTYNGEGLSPLETNINYPNFVFPMLKTTNMTNSNTTTFTTSTLDIYFTDRYRLRKITQVNGTRSVFTIAGNSVNGLSGEGASLNSSLNQPSGLYVSPNQDFILFSENHRIRMIDLIQGTISTIVGGFNNSKGFNGDGLLANETLIDTPKGITIFNGDIYFVDSNNHRVRRVDSRTNRVQTVAGNGMGSYNGDGIKATLASLNTPIEIVFNSLGEMFITDALNSLIRKVDVKGIISTVAGNYGALLVVDGVPATQTALGNARSIAFSPFSERLMFIADSFNHLIRVVDMKTGIINTLAGQFGFRGYISDIMDAIYSVLDTPQSMFVDSISGDIVFVERGNALIRKLSPYCSSTSYSLSYDFSVCYDSCFGVKLNDTRVCSGRGQCISQDTCRCQSGYAGPKCEFPICFGISANLTQQVCGNGNGTCIQVDTCSCRSGFIGKDCSIPVCIAILSGSDLSQNSTAIVECAKTIVKGSELNVQYLDSLNDLNSRTITFNGFQNILVEFPSNVSSDLSQKGLNSSTNLVLVSSAYLQTQQPINETSFKTPLISVSLFDKNGLPITISNLEKPIQLHFTTNSTMTPQSNPSTFICVYYHEVEKVWKTDGVETIRSSSSNPVLTCSTTHLTSFAVIDSSFKKATESNNKAQTTGLSPETQLAIAFSVVGSLLVVGVIAALVMGVILIFYCKMRRKKKNEDEISL
nr:unnamed protein product [Naegleria fowleri]